jgi:aminopeptidase N
MKWWNDLWLNEGFATWMEYIGTNYTHPEWREMDQLLIESMNTMVLDSLEKTHSINFNVNDPREINNLFDSISYLKVIS